MLRMSLTLCLDVHSAYLGRHKQLLPQTLILENNEDPHWLDAS